jgi:hypothetical protein
MVFCKGYPSANKCRQNFYENTGQSNLPLLFFLFFLIFLPPIDFLLVTIDAKINKIIFILTLSVNSENEVKFQNCLINAQCVVAPKTFKWNICGNSLTVMFILKTKYGVHSMDLKTQYYDLIR